jgi:N4-(beta-N-acetylglucosaminyl)-L-asparaginase
MEQTPHVILAGAGAEKFAQEMGMESTELLTEASRQAWIEWRKDSNYAPVINIENHDTIGILAMDDQGRIAGGCTTSGLAYKMHGRIGDSPIIGAGLFVDGEIGAATATGLGEAVLKTLGSFLVVELMRQGKSPQAACEEAVHRIMRRQDTSDLQVGYCAMAADGSMGAHSIHEGFTTAQSQENQHELFHASFG